MSWGTKETYMYFRTYDLDLESQGRACIWPASNFMGINPIATDRTELYFKATIGKAKVDTVTLTHSIGKHKELCEALAIALNSDKTKLVVFADGDNGQVGNYGGITADFTSIKLGVGITAVSINFAT
jgi:hypothetical protein